MLPALISSVALASLVIAMPANAAHQQGHHQRGHHQNGHHGKNHHGKGHHGKGHHGNGHHPVLRVGARVNDMSWRAASGQLGQLAVTRLFYRTLPKTFSRQGIPDGVELIVSYKTPNANVQSYVRSIPRGQHVQLAFHHEPEGDYSNGATFVSLFNAQERLAKSVKPHLKFDFIAGGYQYGSPRRNGWSGSFIPPHADRYYMDSYQRGTKGSPIVPARKDPSVQRYMSLLASKGHRFNGFTEYGRGAIDKTHPLTRAIVDARVKVFAKDDKYLRSLPGIRVWSYWYTTDLGSGTQWRLTDRRSQEAWRAVEAG